MSDSHSLHPPRLSPRPSWTLLVSSCRLFPLCSSSSSSCQTFMNLTAPSIDPRVLRYANHNSPPSRPLATGRCRSRTLSQLLLLLSVEPTVAFESFQIVLPRLHSKRKRATSARGDFSGHWSPFCILTPVCIAQPELSANKCHLLPDHGFHTSAPGLSSALAKI